MHIFRAYFSIFKEAHNFHSLLLVILTTMCIITESQYDLQTIDNTFQDINQYNGVPLDISWEELEDVKYLTSGGSSNVYRAIFRGMPCIIKILKPEIADNDTIINEIELEIHVISKLNHPNIVKLYGAGYNSKQQRFIILEQLNGGTLEKIFDCNSKNTMKAKNNLPLKDVISNALAIAKRNGILSFSY